MTSLQYPDAAQAYPLSWPRGRPRTPAADRKRAPFQERGRNGMFVKITVSTAIERLEREVDALRGAYLLLSTNLSIGPRGGVSGTATDPGAAAYFFIAKQPYVLACDKYPDTAQNIAALAAHIEATRAIERHGVATAVETLQAFQALPPPPGSRPVRPWPEVFGVMRDHANTEVIEALYRVKAKAIGPGDEGALKELNMARDAARRDLHG